MSHLYLAQHQSGATRRPKKLQLVAQAAGTAHTHGAIRRHRSKELVTVFDGARDHIRSWPPKLGKVLRESDTASRVLLAAALETEWAHDAHVTQYATPNGRRLNVGALDNGQLPDGLTMTTLILDVDGPEHKASFKWRATEASKVKRLLVAHPGAVVFNTKNGYRIVQRLATPVILTDHEDAAAWTAFYLGACDALRQDFGIEADTACADWTHCFRLPRVARDGKRTTPGKFDAKRLSAGGFDTKSVTPRHIARPRVVAANDSEVSDLPPAPEAYVKDYIAYLKERPDKECDGVGQHNARYVYALEGARRGLNADQITDAMQEHYLPRHTNTETSDADLHTRVVNALRQVQGDPESRYEAQVYGVMLRREANREVRHERKQWRANWATKRARWGSDRSIEISPESDYATIVKRWRKIVERRRADREAERDGKAKDNEADPLGKYAPPDDPTAEIPELPYICRRLALTTGKVSIFSGAAGAGKSPLAMQFAISVAAGKPFLGEHVEQRPVLMLNFEGGILPLQRRARICRAMGVNPGAIPLEVRRVSGVLTDEMLIDVCKAALRIRDRYGAMPVIILDTLTAANGGLDQNAAEYSEPLFALGDLGDLLQTLIVVLAHQNKNGGVSGHNSIRAAAQTIVELSQDGVNKNLVTIACDRAPEGVFEPLSVRWTDISDPNGGSGLGSQMRGEKWGLLAEPTIATNTGARTGGKLSTDEWNAVTDSAILELLEAQPIGLTTREVCSAVQGQDSKIRDRLKALAGPGNGRVVSEVSGSTVRYIHPRYRPH